MDRVMKLQQARARAKESGFTLVELAIVLVIIGLIVGGVLVGQDLIKAAELRATSSDIEKYNAAANTFRNRFNGLPGDLLAGRADQFGMPSRTGDAGEGDGNGLMEGCAESASALGCETAIFWVDLTRAQLIANAFTVGAGASDGIDDTALAAGDAFGEIANVSDGARFLPSTPLRESAFIHVYPQGGRNFYYLGALETDAAGVVSTVGPAAGGHDTTGLAGLTPAEASQLDDKVDDGAPTTGILRAVVGMTATAGATVDGGGAGNVTGLCVESGTADPNDETYNTVNDDFANQLNCNIYWRSSF